LQFSTLDAGRATTSAGVEKCKDGGQAADEDGYRQFQRERARRGGFGHARPQKSAKDPYRPAFVAGPVTRLEAIHEGGESQ
jgi:ribosomal protein L44E